MPKGFTSKEWLDMFPVLESVTRFNMLIFLHNEGDKTIDVIREKFSITDHWFPHYINPLLREQLVEYNREEYPLTKIHITEKGERVLKILSPEEGGE